ncbi:F-box protein At-B [Typha latifolia]|uniref:F-box protein At-B n=1 Tax=Typha latifolia TaxID=4733 RepID=UPI003C2CEFEA
MENRGGRGGESCGGGGELMERLPQSLLVDILARLDLDSLCSAAPVCRGLRLSVSQALSSISNLDLSGFPLTLQILNRVLSGNNILRSLTLDCSRLDDSSINTFAKEHLHELSLLRCSMFSSYIFLAIGEKCPNLRLFAVDMVHPNENEPPSVCGKAIAQLFKGCLYLESVSIKFQLQFPLSGYFESIQLVLPKSIEVLLLQPISSWQANLLVLSNVSNSDPIVFPAVGEISYLRPQGDRLRSLSLVLDIITDELLVSLTSSLHHLVELCLEDRPMEEPSSNSDLTNVGLQSLEFCHSLTRLCLTRSKQHSPATFRRVNDVGILLLAEGCKRLESIRLGGFSRVTDAGYVSLLHSCKQLKKFEIINAFFLSDLAFLDLAGTACSLVEVRLVSCNLLTSETAESLSSCKSLEVLDFSGCRSVADSGLISISKLSKLTILDLGGADITDIGLSALGDGSSPISSLCLRGCKRITDRGITLLLLGDGVISRTLLTLDLGYLPAVSDRAVSVVAESCRQIISICVRNCFSISDTSIAALGSPDHSAGAKTIRMLDLCHCSGLSVDSLRLLARPFFRGLRWLGIGNTKLLAKGKEKVMELLEDRPVLNICLNGCEMDCKDGWQYHECTEQ